MSEKVRQGQLWLVVESFFSTGQKALLNGRPCKVEISKGEIIEVRYPYCWHLRTSADDLYFHIDEETLIEKCMHYADVKEETRSGNAHKLSEILEQELFERVEREPAVMRLVESMLK